MTWLASPLPGYLCDRVGCRVTNIIGGTLCVTGLVLTSFSHSLNLIYLTHSLLFGFGVCFIYNCSYLVIAQYFKENLSMATGIVALGASVGVLFTGPLLQVLLDSFGWRGTYRVVAACFTLVCILSLTYNPNVQKITHTKLLSSSEDPGSDKRSGISLYCSVWAFPTFAASVMSFMFGSLGMYIPYIYLVSFLPVFLYLNTILRPPRCCDNLINATTFFSSPTKVQSLPLLYIARRMPTNNYCYCCYWYYYYYYYYYY